MTQASNLAVAGGHVQSPGYFITSGTVNGGAANPLTSGTAVTFTGIPSWVKRITIMFNGVSTSGTSNPQIQLGTGATPTYANSGYQNQNTNTTTSAAGASVNATSGFVFGSGNAANTLTGQFVLTNVTGNTWVGNGVMFFSTTAMGFSVGGITLGAALTAVQVTTVNTTDTFDAGSINILYEG